MTILRRLLLILGLVLSVSILFAQEQFDSVRAGVSSVKISFWRYRGYSGEDSVLGFGPDEITFNKSGKRIKYIHYERAWDETVKEYALRSIDTTFYTYNANAGLTGIRYSVRFADQISDKKYEYDSAGKLIRERWYEGKKIYTDLHYKYDKIGRLEAMFYTNSNGRITYHRKWKYDSEGRLTYHWDDGDSVVYVWSKDGKKSSNFHYSTGEHMRDPHWLGYVPYAGQDYAYGFAWYNEQNLLTDSSFYRRASNAPYDFYLQDSTHITRDSGGNVLVRYRQENREVKTSRRTHTYTNYKNGVCVSVYKLGTWNTNDRRDTLQVEKWTYDQSGRVTKYAERIGNGLYTREYFYNQWGDMVEQLYSNSAIKSDTTIHRREHCLRYTYTYY